MAPLAFSVAELPEQIVGDVADALTVGVGFTVTATVCVALVQPPAVPLTV